MSLLSQFRGFIRAFRRAETEPSAPSSLARTIRESTHVRGAFGGLGRAGTERQHDIVAEGHERYAKSFDEE